MITLTKEWLHQTIAEYEANRDELPFGLDTNSAIELQAFKMALASLEAEAVAYVDPFAFNNFSVYRAGDTDNKRMGREWMWANPDAGLIPVYTAQPAPVSVPDDEQCKPHPVMAVKGELGFLDHFDRIISERDEDIDIGQLGSSNYEALMLAALDAFRAAMLHGADGNSPVVPDDLIRRIAFSLVYLAADEKLRSDEDSLFALVRQGIDVVLRELAAPQQEDK